MPKNISGMAIPISTFTYEVFMAEKVSKEILRKSAERVQKYGEVYTPMWLVKDMCDMLGDESPEAWTVLDKTFLEPACGNGKQCSCCCGF